MVASPVLAEAVAGAVVCWRAEIFGAGVARSKGRVSAVDGRMSCAFRGKG